MTAYVHHVPGRLRVRAPVLRAHPDLAKRVAEHLQGMAGIRSAVPNPLTGSILVRYDTACQSHHALLDAFHGHGVLARAVEPHTVVVPRTAAEAYATHARTRMPFGAAAGVARRIGRIMLTAALEALIERSAIALVAELL